MLKIRRRLATARERAATARGATEALEYLQRPLLHSVAIAIQKGRGYGQRAATAGFEDATRKLDLLSHKDLPNLAIFYHI